jgi:hypothetical protein
MNQNGDPRVFLKNGELVTPTIKIEFSHRKTLDVSGIDVSLYNEVATHEFDPSDMEPVKVRSLDQEFAELNK